CVSPLFLGVSAGSPCGGETPHSVDLSEKRILPWAEELAIRLVQLLIQVEQLNPVFGLFGLAKAKNQPKKVPQGRNVVKKVEIFECLLFKNTTCSLRNF
ncbi:hypothetical protein ACT7DL_15215, partial [Bacillus paranthracis]